MASERREEVRVVRDDNFERKERIVERQPSARRVAVARLSQFIWLVVTVVLILLAFRFVLFLLAVNPANGFASAIFVITDSLVAPFMTLMNPPTLDGSSFIDVASLFAMVVYSLVGWGVTQLIRILLADAGGVRRVKTVQRERVD